MLIVADTTAAERAALRAEGFEIGETIEDDATRAAVAEERDAQREAESLATEWAEDGVPKSRAAVAPRGETVVQRADRFTNYAGTFLYVEAYSKQTVSTGATTFSGPTLAMSYTGADGVYGAATEVPRYIDGTTTPDTYMFHRLLVRLTGADAQIPVADLTVRVASTSGAVDTSKVKDWPGGGSLPPHIAGYQQGFFNRYQDPTENRAQLDRLAAEFPNLVTAVNLPHLSPGYQRKAQTIAGAWAGTGTQPRPVHQPDGFSWPRRRRPGPSSSARRPGAMRAATGSRRSSSRARGRTPRCSSASTARRSRSRSARAPTAPSPAPRPRSSRPSTPARRRARSSRRATYRGNAGAGIPRTSGEVQTLADFLNAPAHVQRGPFQQRVYRIGAHRDGTKVGVFFTCQTHAREWTTGLTCVETAERLVRNYATDPETKQLLDNTEVFIHANGNPDGGHYSMYDFARQRRNLSNHCDAATNNDPLARNTWGVDLNRNYTEYTRFDGAWVGASASCTSDSYSGPSEASEPETKNDMWIADTYPNIKFASNMHSFGGYFMWSPGAYLDDGKRTLSPAPNIGVEKYFFEAGEKILGRIKEFRGTVITPARTGPIADVIYSGAG